MSDVTGTVSLGDGFSLGFDFNPTSTTLALSLKWHGVSFATTTLSKSASSTTFGGSVPDTDLKAEATVSANWTTDELTYSVVVQAPMTKEKKYSGSTKF